MIIIYGALNISNSLFKLISKDLAISKPPSDWSDSGLVGPLKFTGGLRLTGTLWVVVRQSVIVALWACSVTRIDFCLKVQFKIVFSWWLSFFLRAFRPLIIWGSCCWFFLISYQFFPSSASKWPHDLGYLFETVFISKSWDSNSYLDGWVMIKAQVTCLLCQLLNITLLKESINTKPLALQTWLR